MLFTEVGQQRLIRPPSAHGVPEELARLITWVARKEFLERIMEVEVNSQVARTVFRYIILLVMQELMTRAPSHEDEQMMKISLALLERLFNGSIRGRCFNGEVRGIILDGVSLESLQRTQRERSDRFPNLIVLPFETRGFEEHVFYPTVIATTGTPVYILWGETFPRRERNESRKLERPVRLLYDPFERLGVMREYEER